MPEKYVARTYRDWAEDDPALLTFQVQVRETDLWVRLGAEAGTLDELRRLTERLVWEARRGLEAYLIIDPAFRGALTPRPVPPHAPRVVRRMAEAAAACGVGPMAAVAGAVAAQVGEALRERSPEVMVENGGDLYIASVKPRTIAVFAGESPFTGRLGLRLSPEALPTGVCTSAGTVGPSFSFGTADAAVIVARDPALADAAATAAGNLVHGPADLQRAVEHAVTIPGVTGALVIKGETLAAAGQLELVRL